MPCVPCNAIHCSGLRSGSSRRTAIRRSCGRRSVPSRERKFCRRKQSARACEGDEAAAGLWGAREGACRRVQGGVGGGGGAEEKDAVVRLSSWLITIGCEYRLVKCGSRTPHTLSARWAPSLSLPGSLPRSVSLTRSHTSLSLSLCLCLCLSLAVSLGLGLSLSLSLSLCSSL